MTNNVFQGGVLSTECKVVDELFSSACILFLWVCEKAVVRWAGGVVQFINLYRPHFDCWCRGRLSAFCGLRNAAKPSLLIPGYSSRQGTNLHKTFEEGDRVRFDKHMLLC